MGQFDNTNTVAANVLGTIGTVLWCVQLIPQIIRNYRVKDCSGLPPLMLFLWAACGIPFAIYFIATEAAIPVQVQPEVFTVFCAITWAQSLYYPPCSMQWQKIAMCVGSLLAVSVGLQAGMITYLKNNYADDPKNWRFLIFGIIASVLLAIGLLPPYLELAKRKGRVVGINFLFLAVDCSGALFSMFSVIFGNMDVMGISLYCICAALEIGIFLSHFIWCCRFKWFGREKVSDEEKEVTETNIETISVTDGQEKKTNKDIA
ncbi:Ilt1 protein [Saccharomycopsis crataegensis]|uniref:Ilt1 protein n=1 Tax=Saccharomycopsis crataegensis TaxID=43959 RepID=A0AAV5QSM1_9ASCO|nr:Ilt1 protein [Saccharomycopsis crataegensis]